MAEYTKNYNLEKQQGNEYISIEGLNENFDKIDTVLGNSSRFENASGTGTAITLNGIVLEDGASKTFITSANNNGAAITINGKKLYKSGTTIAPSLISGKAVTVWYSQANDCFYADAYAGESHAHAVSDITNFPTSLPANGGNADTILIKDVRLTNETPAWYFTNYPSRTVIEFKTSNSIGLPGSSYVCLTTFVPWSDSSGGYPIQYAKDVNNIIRYRYGTSNTAWSSWLSISNEGHTHGAASITAGALPVGVTAAGTNTDYSAARLRNIYAGPADLTAGSSAVPSGYIYIVYE